MVYRSRGFIVPSCSPPLPPPHQQQVQHDDEQEIIQMSGVAFHHVPSQHQPPPLPATQARANSNGSNHSSGSSSSSYASNASSSMDSSSAAWSSSSHASSSSSLSSLRDQQQHKESDTETHTGVQQQECASEESYDIEQARRDYHASVAAWTSKTWQAVRFVIEQRSRHPAYASQVGCSEYHPLQMSHQPHHHHHHHHHHQQQQAFAKGSEGRRKAQDGNSDEELEARIYSKKVSRARHRHQDQQEGLNESSRPSAIKDLSYSTQPIPAISSTIGGGSGISSLSALFDASSLSDRQTTARSGHSGSEEVTTPRAGPAQLHTVSAVAV